MIDANQALANLTAVTADNINYFRAECAEDYKDFYGIRARHMGNWTHLQLLEWFKTHYEWDMTAQAWIWTDYGRKLAEMN